MIKMKRKKCAKIATGEYINLFDKDGVDMFIIINEPNGTIGNLKMCSITSWLREMSEQNDLSTIDLDELSERLEKEFFMYGVQIIRR